MIDKHIAIAGLARDCGENLLKIIPLIEELRNNFTWSYVIVIENDSKDDTRNVLKNWSEQSTNITVKSQNYGYLSFKTSDTCLSKDRIVKMAFYRNMYMQYLNTINHNIDYLIVIDLDLPRFSIPGILNSIRTAPSDWGGLFAYGVTVNNLFGFLQFRLYYDIFAFSDEIEKNSFNKDSLKNEYKSIQNKLRKCKNFYKVISAFGGIGIYKYNIIKGQEYTMKLNNNNSSEAICEHIPFNESVVSKGFSNYISKEMLVVYGKHNLPALLSIFLPQSIFSSMQRSFHYGKSFITRI